MKFTNMIALSTILLFSIGLDNIKANATNVNADNVNAEQKAPKSHSSGHGLRGGGGGRILHNDDPILTKFKHDHDLRKDAVLDLQSVSNHSTVNVAGKEYSLDALDPLNVFTDNATYTLDGELQPSPPVSKGLFIGTGSTDGSIILVTTNDRKEVDTVDIFRSDGSDDHLVSVMPNILARIKPNDLDPKVLEGLKIDMTTDEDVADIKSKAFENDHQTDGEQEKEYYSTNSSDIEGFGERFLLEEDDDSAIIGTSQTQETRALQNPSICSTHKIIEVAIVFDSTFCERYGGLVSAWLKVLRIVARVSMMYQGQGGVCTKVRISHLEGRCNRYSDPYRSLVVNGDMSCNQVTSKDILRNFSNNHRRDQPSVIRDHADAVHLFFGTRRPGAIGCAYTHTLCESSAYGVNDMSYTNNELLHSVLFAHELGHNAGLGHVSGSPIFGKYIMASSLSPDSFYRWSPTSVNTLKSNLFNKFSCLSTETGSGAFSRQFLLINPATGKALDVHGARCNPGTNIHLWDRNDSGAQVFHYHYATKAIVNVKCDMAIDIYKGSCNRGTNVILWNRHGGNNQKFQFYSDQTIRSVGCNGKALDIYQKYTARGTNIWLYDVNSQWDKKWQAVYV